MTHWRDSLLVRQTRGASSGNVRFRCTLSVHDVCEVARSLDENERRFDAQQSARLSAAEEHASFLELVKTLM